MNIFTIDNESQLPENADVLVKQLLAGGGVRAVAVHLSHTWQAILAGRNLPPAVLSMLGEMCAASAVLAATLKFNGALVLQIMGDGPVKLAVVECDADMRIRAAIKLREGMEIATDANFQSLVNATGQGRCAVVLDPKDKLPGQTPYTGIVALNGKTVAACLEHYMKTSEQLSSKIVLSANNTAAAGLLVQKMPVTGGTRVLTANLETGIEEDLDEINDENWVRIQNHVATLKAAEHLSIDAPTLLHRLFWEENAAATEGRRVAFACTCSRHKVGDMLLRLGQAEVESILSERETIDVQCDYCDQSYAFDAIDAAVLFKANAAAGADSLN